MITEAGTDPSVAGLVYVAAHMPDAGENEADDGRRIPGDLGKSGALKKTSDGFTYLDPARFHEYFAADLSAEQAAFMARSQVFNLADNFSATITTAAWRTNHCLHAVDLALRSLRAGCVTGCFLPAVFCARLYDSEVASDTIDLDVHGLAEHLEPVHGLFARFPTFFDLVFDLFHEKVEFLAVSASW